MISIRTAMDIAITAYDEIEFLFPYVLLSSAALGMLAFAVVFALVRRKKAKEKEEEQKLMEQMYGKADK